MSRWLMPLAAGILALGLSACSQQLSWPDQINTSGIGAVSLAAGATVGQTLVALEAGLNGLDVFLSPQGALQGDVQLVLQLPPGTPGAGVDLASSRLSAASVTRPAFYHFAFAALPNSRLNSYYLRLAYAGPGQLLVGHGPPDSYLQGALYRNDGPDDSAQMAFRLTYDAAQVAHGVAVQAATWLVWLIAAALLFLVPGWALLVWFWPRLERLSWGEQMGLAAGLSVAVYPILFLWTSLVGLQMAGLYAYLPVSVGLVALVVWLARRWRHTSPHLRLASLWSPNLAPDLAFIMVVTLILFTRFWAVRSLPAPMWGNSYQHTLITQLILDHGGLFTSWAPYADLTTFTYHFGFHTLASVFHWFTGLPALDAVLWTGQILNCLAVFALYPLAMRLSGQRWVGVGAVLVAGLLTATPMVYTDWGRYTQLAGQAVLPVALTLAWMVLDDEAPGGRAVVLAGLAIGGLALSHYRILIFGLIFFVAYLLLNFRQFRGAWLRFLGMGLIGGVIFLPWFIRVFGGQVLAIFSAQMRILPTTSAVSDSNSFGNLDLYPIWLWLVAAFSLALGLWRRDRCLALIGLWGALVLVAANPQWLRLPGQGALSNFAVFVAAYIPLGLLIGATLGWLAGRWPRLAPAGLLAVVLLAGLAGARQRLSDLQSQQFSLVTWPDIRAADWIAKHAPPDARFLVNSFLAYGSSLAVGSDAGWWLPILAGRATNLPPINYAFELSDRADYRTWVNELPAAIQSSGIGNASVAQLLANRGITYVFLGQLRGSVNNPGSPVLDAGSLLAAPGFQLVYHQDRVFIFQVAR